MILFFIIPFTLWLIFLVVCYRLSALFTYLLDRFHVSTIRNIVYVSDSMNPKHRLDIYKPKKIRDFPVVHFIHGGYWTSGDKNYHQWITGLYAAVGCSLARRGIGVVISNYRLAPEVGIKQQLEDIEQAIRWTAENMMLHGASKDTYLMGHSAGGHLISQIAAEARHKEIKGYLALSPILDIANMIDLSNSEFNEKVSYKVFGTDKKSWDAYSPMQHFTKTKLGTIPFKIIYAEHDFPVVLKQAKQAEPILAKLSQKASVLKIPHYNHMGMMTNFGKPHDLVMQEVIKLIRG